MSNIQRLTEAAEKCLAKAASDKKISRESLAEGLLSDCLDLSDSAQVSAFVDSLVIDEAFDLRISDVYFVAVTKLLDLLADAREAQLLGRWSALFGFWQRLSYRNTESASKILNDRFVTGQKWLTMQQLTSHLDYQLEQSGYNRNFAFDSFVETFSRFAKNSSALRENLFSAVTRASMSPLDPALFAMRDDIMPVYQKYRDIAIKASEQAAIERGLVRSRVKNKKILSVLQANLSPLLEQTVEVYFELGGEHYICTDSALAIVREPGMFENKSKALTLIRQNNQIVSFAVGDKHERNFEGTTYTDYYYWLLTVIVSDGTQITREILLGSSEQTINSNRRYWTEVLKNIGRIYPVTDSGQHIEQTSGYITTYSYGWGIRF